MKKEKARPKQVYMQRVKCDCMAQKHQLINNCLSCGKIVCAQEGEGNCLYCGKLVVRPDGMFIDDSETLFPSLSKDEQKNAAIERSKAIQHKNKLVERGRTLGQNQNIFDQQVDYYQISENKWLDEGDRQKAIERILQKDQMVQDESRKVNIKYDHVSGQFVREQFKFDEDQFRKEGRTFLQQKQLQQKLEKEKEIKVKHNWDERILRSQKMKDLCEQMLPKQGKRVTNQAIKRSQLATTDIILQKQ